MITTQRSAPSVSRRTAMASLDAGGLAVAASQLGASAQDATPGETTGHPIVGAWRWQNNPDDPSTSTSFAVFHGDETYVEFDPAVGVGIGTWRATGERTGDLTIVFQDNDLDPNLLGRGLGTFWMTVEADGTGNAIAATGELEAITPDGETVNFPYVGTGTRIEPLGSRPGGSALATPET